MPDTPKPSASATSVTRFQGKQIRRAWHNGRWFFSVVDVVGLLTESAEPRRYWSDMKRRIRDEGFRELYAKCVQLKLPSADGKSYVTDTADTETLLRIIQSIPSPKAEPVKQWLAKVGTERLAELENPALAVDRAREYYSQRGYPPDWIEKRLQGIVIRQELTEEWKERGAEEGREFAILTDILNRGTFGLKVEEHKAFKNLKRHHNLRDSMTTLELALIAFAEASATELHQARDSQGFPALQEDVCDAGEVAGAARRDLEARTGRRVVSSENYRTLISSNRDTQRQLPAADRPADSTSHEP
jgi:DNA-damage-inducible protein D